MTKKRDEAYGEAVNLTRRNALAKGVAVFSSVVAGCPKTGNTPTSTPAEETPTTTSEPTDSPTPTEGTQVIFSNSANYDRIKHYLERQPFVNKKSTRMYKDVTGMLKLAEASDKDIEIRTPSTPLVASVPGTEVSEDDVRYGSRTSWEDSVYSNDLFEERSYNIEEALDGNLQQVNKINDFKIFASSDLADSDIFIGFNTKIKYEIFDSSRNGVERAVDFIYSDDRSMWNSIEGTVVDDFLEDSFAFVVGFGKPPAGSEMPDYPSPYTLDFANVIYQDSEDGQLYETRFKKWAEDSEYGNGWERGSTVDQTVTKELLLTN